jgi:hypothetical protein
LKLTKPSVLELRSLTPVFGGQDAKRMEPELTRRQRMPTVAWRRCTFRTVDLVAGLTAVGGITLIVIRLVVLGLAGRFAEFRQPNLELPLVAGVVLAKYVVGLGIAYFLIVCAAVVKWCVDVWPSGSRWLSVVRVVGLLSAPLWAASAMHWAFFVAMCLLVGTLLRRRHTRRPRVWIWVVLLVGTGLIWSVPVLAMLLLIGANLRTAAQWAYAVRVLAVVILCGLPIALWFLYGGWG